MRVAWSYLEQVPYRLALRWQQQAAERVRRGEDGALLLLEHPPTVTLGRSADPQHLRLPLQEYRRRGIPVVRVKRGGDVTFHGPGQLVGYPVVSLAVMRVSVPEWVRGNAEALIGFLADRGVPARWCDEHPGVWVGQDKIAAVGFHLDRRVSTHGFALNLGPDLSGFETIVPCGLYQRGVTSLARLGVESPPMAQAAREVAERLARRFGWRLVPAAGTEAPVDRNAAQGVRHACPSS